MDPLEIAGAGSLSERASADDAAELRRGVSRSSFVSTSSKKQREKRKFNMSETMESVFELLVGDYGAANQLEISVRFYEFYNGPLLRSLVAASMFYFYAYIRVADLFAKQLSANGVRSHAPQDMRPDFGASKELHDARREQVRRLEAMARSYARLLLSCSNYEQSVDDLLFFECIYHFVYLVVRQSVDPSPLEARTFYETVKAELCFVFRGPSFDVEAKRAASKRSKAKSADLKRIRHEVGGSEAAYKGVADSTGQHRAHVGAEKVTAHGPAQARQAMSRPNWGGRSFRSSGESHASGEAAGRVPVDVSASPHLGMESIIAERAHEQERKRADGPGKSPGASSVQQRGHRQRRKTKQNEQLFELAPALELGAGLGLDLDLAKPKHREPRFSIHKAMTARSPLLTLLLNPK